LRFVESSSEELNLVQDDTAEIESADSTLLESTEVPHHNLSRFTKSTKRDSSTEIHHQGRDKRTFSISDHRTVPLKEPNNENLQTRTLWIPIGLASGLVLISAVIIYFLLA